MPLNTNADQVTLVNDRDEVIGQMDRIEAHRGQAQLHRAISVYLFDSNGQLLLQQRSAKKIVGAHQWANTCCGNVRPSEDYLACASRRLKEELGIENVELKPVYKFQYSVACNAEFSEREMDQVFVGLFNGPVSPNPDEVQAYRWAEFDELLQTTDASYAPWFRLMMQDQTLIKQLESSRKDVYV